MNPEDERYAQQLIERMKQQNQMMNPAQMPARNPEPVSDGASEINAQNVISSVQNSGPPEPAHGAFSVCPQCNTMHPPLKPGQKCPVAKVEVPEAGVSDADISKFVVDLRNIAISQIEKKGIKDGNKLFKHLTIEFMKSLEGYNE